MSVIISRDLAWLTQDLPIDFNNSVIIIPPVSGATVFPMSGMFYKSLPYGIVMQKLLLKPFLRLEGNGMIIILPDFIMLLVEFFGRSFKHL